MSAPAVRAKAAAAEGPIGTREAWRYVAERLPGWPLAERTFLYHAARGHIPALRLGSRYLFWTSELDAWLASRVGPRAVERSG